MSRVILGVAALLWLLFVVRTSRDVPVASLGPRPEFHAAPSPIPAARLRPAITLDEGAAGREIRLLRDHWQRAGVLLR
jgi:hypothetical protein